MSVMYRLGGLNDLAACAALLKAEDCFQAPDHVWGWLEPCWRRALEAGQMHFMVFEDYSAASTKRLVSFFMTVMVTDQFVGRLKTGADAFAAQSLYTATGFDVRYVLDYRQIAKANAQHDLHLMMLHNPLPSGGLTEAAVANAMPLFLAGFHFEHGGYNLRSIVWEVYGELFCSALSTAGYKILNPATVQPQGAAKDPQRRAILMGKFREDSSERSYSGSALLVLTRRTPRLGFTRHQQRLLRLALMEHADIELEGLLGVSRNAIKQTWRGIFEKARSGLGHLFDGLDDADEGRGLSLRRIVINYVRQHPEELRPWDAKSLSKPH
jgi:hypothetical protein